MGHFARYLFFCCVVVAISVSITTGRDFLRKVSAEVFQQGRFE